MTAGDDYYLEFVHNNITFRIYHDGQIRSVQVPPGYRVPRHVYEEMQEVRKAAFKQTQTATGFMFRNGAIIRSV